MAPEQMFKQARRKGKGGGSRDKGRPMGRQQGNWGSTVVGRNRVWQCYKNLKGEGSSGARIRGT